jgi:hypothetical protein
MIQPSGLLALEFGKFLLMHKAAIGSHDILASDF